MADPRTPGDAPYEAALDAIIGRRAEQQDCGLIAGVSLRGRREALLIIVADGMGGHAGGAIASRLAVDAFQLGFFARPGRATAERLREGLERANAALARRIAESPELSGMGCTLVAVVLDGQDARWISVGDTLLLASRGGRLQRLNADHSVGGMLDLRAGRGEISREEAEDHPQRHMLRSAVTGDDIALTDEGEARLGPGELLIAATDGVLTLPMSDLAALAAAAPSPQALVSAVLQAVERGMPDDQDNLTLAAARAPGRRKPAAAGGRGRWRRILGFGLSAAVLAVLAFLAVALTRPAKPPAAASSRDVHEVKAPAMTRQAPGGSALDAASFGKSIRLPVDGPQRPGSATPKPKPAAPRPPAKAAPAPKPSAPVDAIQQKLDEVQNSSGAPAAKG